MAVSRLCVGEAAEGVVDAYRNYELIERGLAEVTVVNACHVVRQFLAWRAATGRPALEHLGVGELGEFVSHEAGRLKIGAVRQTVTVLRTFTRFLFATGVCASDLSGAVPSVSGVRFDGLPKAVDREVVDALLASCVLDRPTGRRDFAILLLMARLGLRAVEIARMQLDDVDWRAGEMEVRGKGGRRDRLPLPGDVGQALADYLVKARRPSSCRAVFLAAAGAPVGMSPNAVVFVSRTASGRAGIAVVGGHRLRHDGHRVASRRGEPARGRLGPAPERSDDDLDLRQDRRALAALGGAAVAGQVSAMNNLESRLERYLALRRSLGYQLCEHGEVLPGFVRYAHERGETTVRTTTALAWAGLAGSDGQRGRRLSMVRGLARYLVAFDPGTEVPPRLLLGEDVPRARRRHRERPAGAAGFRRDIDCSAEGAPRLSNGHGDRSLVYPRLGVRVHRSAPPLAKRRRLGIVCRR